MRDLLGSKKTKRQKSVNPVENSKRVPVAVIFALVALLVWVIFFLLNFSLSGDGIIRPSTVDSAKVSGGKNKKEPLALRSSMGGTEGSQTRAAFKTGKGSQKSKTDESNTLQPGQKSTTALLDEQQDTQPDGQPIDQPDIQLDPVPNEQIEDEQHGDHRKNCALHRVDAELL